MLPPFFTNRQCRRRPEELPVSYAGFKISLQPIAPLYSANIAESSNDDLVQIRVSPICP